MSQFDVLNPTPVWDDEIGDANGPDFGWDQLRASTLAVTKPAFGAPWARTSSVKGASTSFSWLKRSQACKDKLVRWAEQFEDGFFTIIDHDNKREYVGRFTGDLHVSQVGNDSYNLQGWTFEEQPGVSMRTYPSDWEKWGVIKRPIDDYGDQNAATYAANALTWQQPVPVDVGDGTQRAPQQIWAASSAAGDSITHEYRGYGFRLHCGTGPGYGQANLWVDGVLIKLIDFQEVGEGVGFGSVVVYENAELPLGVHRVQLVSNGQRTAGASTNTILWDYLEVMR